MQQKADYQDVSNAITEIVVSTDAKKEIEALKTQLSEYRESLDLDQNKHTKQIFDSFKLETHNLLKQVQQAEDQV